LLKRCSSDVEADEFRALREAGLTDVIAVQLIALQNYAVDAEYVEALRDAGFVNLTVFRQRACPCREA
jgi:hypothetical protein